MYVPGGIRKTWNAKRLCSGGHEQRLALPRDFLGKYDDLRGCGLSMLSVKKRSLTASYLQLVLLLS